MYIRSSLLAGLVLCPLIVFSQATTTAITTPQQTIVPFKTLPACAAQCYSLYDAQGACSPPVVPSTSISCFCGYAALQPFYTAPNVVCPAACPNDPNGLTGIQSWFLGLCSKGTSQTTATGSNPTTTGIESGTAAPVSGGSGANSGSSNQSWVSNHWQWIIMIVVLVLAFIVGWIAACLLRRRYIRRKEREFELRPPAAPWVGGTTHPAAAGSSPYDSGVVGKGKERDSGMFVSRPASAARGTINEKSDGRKKWVVKERT